MLFQVYTPDFKCSKSFMQQNNRIASLAFSLLDGTDVIDVK